MKYNHLWRIALAGIIVAFGCNSDDLDGPQRSGFQGIAVAQISVERGDVLIFGSNDQARAILDRWTGPLENFELLEERKEGRTLVVETRCVRPGACKSRHDFALDSAGAWTVQTGEGAVEIIRGAGPIDIIVERGSLRGARLTSKYFDAHIMEGTTRLQFDEPPVNLNLRLGTGEATVILPDQRYRCEFDEEAENITLNNLHCHSDVEDAIYIDSSSAKIRFEVHGDDD